MVHYVVLEILDQEESHTQLLMSPSISSERLWSCQIDDGTYKVFKHLLSLKTLNFIMISVFSEVSLSSVFETMSRDTQIILPCDINILPCDSGISWKVLEVQLEIKQPHYSFSSRELYSSMWWWGYALYDARIPFCHSKYERLCMQDHRG